VGRDYGQRMAKGRAIGRFEAVLGLIGVLALVVTYSVITGWNPLPSWANWIEEQTVRTLASPPTAWTARVGDEPQAAAVFDRVIVVTAEGSVEGRDPLNGVKLWSYPAAWSAAAGNSQPVVVVGRTGGLGFDVYDAGSGVRLWHRDDKEAVWPYQNMVLTLSCPHEFACVLAALKPTDGASIWSLPISGAGQSLHGLRPAFATLAPITNDYTDSFAAMSQPAPSIIGLPIDDDIHAISTASGRELHVYHRSISTRVSVAAHEVVVSTAVVRGGICYPTIEGRSPQTNGVIWTRPGYNPRTASGLGCEQQRDPVGGGDALLVTDPSGHDALLDVRNGDVLFRAPLGEHVLATDGRVAVVRTADKRSVYGVSMSSGHQLWSREAGKTALVGVAQGAVMIADPAVGRIVALAPTSGAALLDVASGATVLGVGAHEIIVSIGRTIGPLPLAAAG